MCGIAGLISCSGAPIDPGLLESMRDRMSHRGPDDAGLYVTSDRTVGLAHRRLSIIDLSSAGHQPMSNEDGTVWISFNGEIFNFPELKARLERQGHRFRSNCDTEVIIHLFEEHGPDCVHHLNGQFAFFIWDEKTRTGFGARDHMGIRPFYYYHDRERFAFASELKGVYPLCGAREIDYAAITDFLVLQYIPAPRTIFKGIMKLQAGTRITLKDGEISTERYWQPRPEHDNGLSEDERLEKLDYLIRQAVSRQMIADVPLGVFLSGGVDSSAITHYMSEISGATVQAFSVGFEEKEYSELEFAARAAAHIPNVAHHQLVLRPGDAHALIRELMASVDEPFADQAIIPTYLMSRYAKKSVTVCLSGEGSDEIFGGYDRYQNTIEKVKLVEELSRFAPELRPHLRESLRLPYEDYLANLCSFHPRELPQLLHSNARTDDDFVRTTFRQFYKEMESSDDLERVQRFDIATYLADNLLFKVDRSSMLASLEVRVPFLDPSVVNYALGLPFHLRYRSHIQKYGLKKIMRGKIPNEIIYRKKMGFSVPIFLWFQKAYNNYLRDTLLSTRSLQRSIFRRSTVERMLDPAQLENNRHNSLKLWCLVVLEEWHRSFHDNL
ncbi:MAG: asparagine synthase (glutamine-hydrolyzing) [Geobacteraceae bacterium]